jgi:CHAT domain-containing protein
MKQWAPGLLSGVLFSGANVPRMPETIDDDLGTNDGILTADELGLLPLEGVQLAVLSACESGLGERAKGEGVLGIQRACQLAGVQSTIASLWKVDDQMTKQLMTIFYANMLKGQQSPLDALRSAQLAFLRGLREDGGGLPSEVRGVDPPPDAVNAGASLRSLPYYWAAFTLSGDWR